MLHNFNLYSNIRLKLSNNRYHYLTDAAIFAVITVLLHLFYYYVIGVFLFQTTFFHQTTEFLAHSVFSAAMLVNEQLFSGSISADYITNTLWLYGTDRITVNEGCSGFKQHYQLLGLFILYPGPLKRKVWYIPFTFFVMHLTNIFRIIVLTIILYYLPNQWDLWHEWVMRPFYYVVIFGLWVIWNERLRVTKQK